MLNTELKEKIRKAAYKASLPFCGDRAYTVEKYFIAGAEWMYAELAPIVEWVIIAYGSPRLNYERKRKLVRILSSNRTFKYIGGQFITFNEDGTQRVSQHNSYKIFDYLHELKIDYRGLIDADLAIDVNTLNENPYK